MKAIPYPPCNWAEKLAEVEAARVAREKQQADLNAGVRPCGCDFVDSDDWACPRCGEV